MDIRIRKAGRAWYEASIAAFVATDADAILGRLAANGGYALVPEQRDAWLAQIAFFKSSLVGLEGAVFLEFDIPRMGRRIDAVLLIGPVVFVVEFKVGARQFDRAALDQVWDYALDLKNFHEASHAACIVPLLVATETTESPAPLLELAPDSVARPLRTHPAGFRLTIETVLQAVAGDALDTGQWGASTYRPTPNIVEAARALYARHSVEEIARHGAINLQMTSQRIEALADQARTGRRKLICFVTGVPGAGKTLVGLNLATRRSDPAEPAHAVFLSGNGPLVAVLREALTRDELARHRNRGEKTTKHRVANPVKAFIQNVHHFRDEALRSESPPVDHVVIFDEAQRAWNRTQTARFMKLRKNQPDFDHSEPAFLMSYLDRHLDWAVIVCLVGGGQEIHTGEAGIGEWLEAARVNFPHWDLHISAHLTDAEYAAGKALQTLRGRENTHFEEHLHLAVSMRSFRAETVSTFVKALLDCEEGLARDLFAKLADRYPICVTRDLDRAKRWLRSRARGNERYGLVASSKAMRLKPHAIDIRVTVDPVHYFLDDRDDTRSSYYLEDCATEFQVQGLELDWACVTWDGDLRHAGAAWSFHDFRGKRWQNVHNADNRNYLRNAYRVLLTRARQGMVLFIPPGDPADPTRDPALYNPTFNYLRALGIPLLT